MIEVQCTSCHTRYRIDEQVLPEGLPTFKCSRCGHVFSFEPRKSRLSAQSEKAASKQERTAEPDSESAYSARQGEGSEPLPRSADVTRDEPAHSFQDSMTVGAPEPSESFRADAASLLQPRPLKSDEPAASSQQTDPSQLESRPRSTEIDPTQPTSTPQTATSPQLAAEQARKFYSRLFTGKDPDAVSGENLSFDFADEEPAPEHASSSRKGRRQASIAPPSGRETPDWQVGDDDPTSGMARPDDRGGFSDEELSRPTRRQIRAGQTEPQFTDDDEFIDEGQAPVYNRGRIHSSRFFVTLIFLIGAGFGALTFLIHGAPTTSEAVLSYLPVVGDRFALPAMPAKLVALRELSAVYQQGKGGPRALVISGTAENVGTTSLRIVQLTAALRDAQRRSLASQAVYCGNNVSPGMVGQMTPHEIEFFQKLEPAKTFALEPSASCRFVAVFMNAPGAAHDYDVSVSQAVPGAASVTEEPGS